MSNVDPFWSVRQRCHLSEPVWPAKNRLLRLCGLRTIARLYRGVSAAGKLACPDKIFYILQKFILELKIIRMLGCFKLSCIILIIVINCHAVNLILYFLASIYISLLVPYNIPWHPILPWGCHQIERERKEAVKAGLGTAFFSVLNTSFFCVLLNNATIFYILFSSFWQLMRPERTMRSFEKNI